MESVKTEGAFFTERKELTPKKLKKKKHLKEYFFVYSFLIIPIMHFIIFYILVNVNSLLMAFQEFQGYGEQGQRVYIWSLGNFSQIWRAIGNPASEFLVALFNTLKYFSVALFLIPITIFVAYFLYKKIPFYRFLRVVFYLPSIISSVVYVTIYKNIISVGGPIDVLFVKFFSRDLPALMANASTATPTIIFYCLWTGLGFNMILFQGAMNRIPDEVLEAGILDGTSWMRELWSIILPMIWPTLSMTIILLFTSLFTAGGPILLFTESGDIPNNKITTISYYIYRLTWKSSSHEYPAAVGILFTLLSLPIVFSVRWFMNRFDPEVEY